jgi:hypothetical protein
MNKETKKGYRTLQNAKSIIHPAYMIKIMVKGVK